MSVTDYFNALTHQWQQLDILEEKSWKCLEDSQQYKKIVEKDRVYQFLLGLNKDLDDVRGRILSIKPLPSVKEVFSEVRREESWKKLMLGSHHPFLPAENSAMIAQGNSFNRDKQQKNRPVCEHCKKVGHTKDICWKLHGKPANWKPAREKEGRGNTAEAQTNAEVNPFSKEQLEALQKILQQTLQNNTTGSGTLASKGIGLGEEDWQC
ncbi:uncharacterized protein LOC127795193 [Diospyros lotus]|uniref:uncharacterized protein LOC127795193 n=1 Tax=Diospyros lotus TaxID=55363 RepID=UPI00224D76C5|nr:uncharacterized protein LOC127795193 [Diospyros lotus]